MAVHRQAQTFDPHAAAALSIEGKKTFIFHGCILISI